MKIKVSDIRATGQATGRILVVQDDAVVFADPSSGAVGLVEVEDDTSPSLGGDLEAGTFSVKSGANVINLSTNVSITSGKPGAVISLSGEIVANNGTFGTSLVGGTYFDMYGGAQINFYDGGSVSPDAITAHPGNNSLSLVPTGTGRIMFNSGSNTYGWPTTRPSTGSYVLQVDSQGYITFTTATGPPSGGTTSQYLRGDNTWQTLDKSAVGLANVDNTADASKPIFTTTTRGLVPASGGTTGKYLRDDSTWQDLPSFGGGSVWTPVSATGTGASQDITLTSAVAADRLFVFINGLLQRPTTDYTVSGTTLTTTAPSGSSVNIYKAAGVDGANGAAGVAGRGITAASVDANNYLNFTYSDTTTSQLGPLVTNVPNVSAWPLFIGSREYNNNGPIFTPSAFTTIAVDSNYDNFNGWNSTNSTWTVPVGHGGVYELTGRWRAADGYPANVSRGLGMDIANQDSPGFFWSTTIGTRDGIQAVRIMSLTPGQALRLFYYWDSGSQIRLTAAFFAIARIR